MVFVETMVGAEVVFPEPLLPPFPPAEEESVWEDGITDNGADEEVSEEEVFEEKL
jgi:hypothetical protein